MSFNLDFHAKSKYSKPLKHALSPYVGLVKGVLFFSILFEIISKYYAEYFEMFKLSRNNYNQIAISNHQNVSK